MQNPPQKDICDLRLLENLSYVRTSLVVWTKRSVRNFPSAFPERRRAAPISVLKVPLRSPEAI